MCSITSIKLIYFLSVALVFCLIFLNKVSAYDDSEVVTLTTDVRPVINLSISSNDYDFGYLTPNVPERGSNAIIATVTTTAANGYDLGINDGIAGSDSCLLNADGITRIIDSSASIGTPEIWDEGTSKGLGVTVFSADTSKEVKWGTGTTFNDSFNKYAGVPQNLATIHTSPGYKTIGDNTGIGFILDVSAGQTMGTYNGSLILTATANL